LECPGEAAQSSNFLQLALSALQSFPPSCRRSPSLFDEASQKCFAGATTQQYLHSTAPITFCPVDRSRGELFGQKSFVSSRSAPMARNFSPSRPGNLLAQGELRALVQHTAAEFLQSSNDLTTDKKEAEEEDYFWSWLFLCIAHLLLWAIPG
jgi:hypothetical protein